LVLRFILKLEFNLVQFVEPVELKTLLQGRYVLQNRRIVFAIEAEVGSINGFESVAAVQNLFATLEKIVDGSKVAKARLVVLMDQ